MTEKPNGWIILIAVLMVFVPVVAGIAALLKWIMG